MTAMEYLYREVTQLFMPSVYLYEIEGESLVYEDIKRLFMPITTEIPPVGKYENPAKKAKDRQNRSFESLNY